MIVAVTACLAWRLLNKRTAALMAVMLILIGAFGYWDLAMMTVSLVAGSVILSLAVGIPIGVITARSDLAEAIVKPILDAMQTMPSFVYLIPALMLFGLGKVPALFRNHHLRHPAGYPADQRRHPGGGLQLH